MYVEIGKLSFPKVSPQGMIVLEVLGREDFTIDDVTAPIIQDPMLSATLIKYANSPLYRRFVEVTNVRNAVNILGLKNVKLAVTVAAIRSIIKKTSPATDAILEHSFAIAALGKMIAQKSLRRFADDVELVGLIHDFASLMLASNFPEDYAKIFSQAQTGQCLDVLERSNFEVDLAALLNWLGKELRLPAITLTALHLFHGTDAGEEVSVLAIKQMKILFLAHWLDLEVRGEGATVRQTMEISQADLMGDLELDENALADIVSKYRELLESGFEL